MPDGSESAAGRAPPGSDLAEVAGSPRRMALISAAIVGVVALGLVVLLAFSDSAVDREGSSPLIGQVAPRIEQTTLDGAVFDLDEQRGSWVVVNFFATWCTPCIDEHPELVEFSRRHEIDGHASVVSIAFDDSASNVEGFFERFGGSWPVIVADAGGLAVDYGVALVPESYLVAPSGVVATKFVGGVEADVIDAVIERLEGAA